MTNENRGCALYMPDKTFFEEACEDEGVITFYFVAPVEMLPHHMQKDAAGACISVEVPTCKMEACEATVMVSPTKVVEGHLADCDWFDVNWPYEVVEELIAKGQSERYQKYVFAENEALSTARIKRAIECLKDNGIDADEADTVLQALCYILLDTEIEELL